jgi:hypothetical protein
MIKQEMDMTDKKQVIEAALLDCEQSLQESYDLIRTTRIHGYKGKDYEAASVLKNISISLTILKLMKGDSDNDL